MNYGKIFLASILILSPVTDVLAQSDYDFGTIHTRNRNRIQRLYEQSKAQPSAKPVITKQTNQVTKPVEHLDKKKKKEKEEEDLNKLAEELDKILEEGNEWSEPQTPTAKKNLQDACITYCGEGYTYSHLGYKNSGKERVCVKYALPCGEQCTVDWKTNYLVQNSDYTCKEAVQIMEKFPFVGPLNAKITLTEFIDFHCGYCKQFAPNFINMIKNNPDVKFVFKPMYFLGSIEIAKAFIAASRQGKTKEAYQAFMNSSSRLSTEQINAVLKNIGLNIAKTRAYMEDKETLETLEQINQEYQAYHMRGVPGLLLNNEKLEIKYIDDIQKAINQKKNK